MWMAVGLILVAVSVVVLARPIFLGDGEDSRGASSERFREVNRRRERTYEDIKSLTLDHELGHVPTEEYHRRLQELRIEAAMALREGDQAREALVRQGKELEDAALALRRNWKTVNSLDSCDACGGRIDVRAAVCPRCEARRDGEGVPAAAGQAAVGQATAAQPAAAQAAVEEEEAWESQ